MDAGKLGKKSGEGLYLWKKGRAVKDKAGAKAADLDKLATRLLEPLLEECGRCLDEGIVEDADLRYIGAVGPSGKREGFPYWVRDATGRVRIRPEGVEFDETGTIFSNPADERTAELPSVDWSSLDRIH